MLVSEKQEWPGNASRRVQRGSKPRASPNVGDNRALARQPEAPFNPLENRCHRGGRLRNEATRVRYTGPRILKEC